MIKFGYRRHCGGLNESLKTSRYISLVRFNKLLPEYEYYAYDNRCKQYLFILRNMEERFNCFIQKNYMEYVNRGWLFIEVQ